MEETKFAVINLVIVYVGEYRVAQSFGFIYGVYLAFFVYWLGNWLEIDILIGSNFSIEI